MSDKVILLHREDYGKDADRLEQLLADTIDTYLDVIQDTIQIFPENGNLFSKSRSIGKISLRRSGTID